MMMVREKCVWLFVCEWKTIHTIFNGVKLFYDSIGKRYNTHQVIVGYYLE